MVTSSFLRLTASVIFWNRNRCNCFIKRACSTNHPVEYVEKSKSHVVETEAEKKFKYVMSKVPQPVVVVTTAKESNDDQLIKRGVTCSSFTSVSLKPPIISFCMNRPSRMHDLLLQTELFAVHVLAKDQVDYGIHFSKASLNGKNQFEEIPHIINKQNLPIIENTSAVLLCNYHSVTTIGDHHVWYGLVRNAVVNNQSEEALLYYSRSFHSIGDEAFMQAFENKTLPFKDWTHEGHLRLAWNYIRLYGKEKATPLIREGIQRYNEENKDKIKHGYNETITQFYIFHVSEAINRYGHPDITFEEFLRLNSHLIDPQLPFKYYSLGVIQSSHAKETFVAPDKQTLV
ncbi:DgyrCDS12515 [Dimorphilus gyrociliatus]|uniref:DgyrCDS12515 n=1 Tax=Dimorphilus gyrociliatus TaxID=2664684 RepID=A0A7I8W7J5_9ANNE|nr:DgyrCDS12515 [Dimorphilus gyrociliatus]